MMNILKYKIRKYAQITPNLDHFRIILSKECYVFENKLLLLLLLKKKKEKIKNKEQQKQLHYRNERSELHGKRAGTKTLENKYL